MTSPSRVQRWPARGSWPARGHPRAGRASARQVQVGERGSATLELVVLAPALLAFLAAAVGAGRVELAAASISAAASQAARQASITFTATAAGQAARAGAERTLAGEHIDCQPLTVAVDTTGFITPPGRPAQVTVGIGCTVPLAEVALPGLPGSRTLVGVGRSPIDAFRERSPG